MRRGRVNISYCMCPTCRNFIPIPRKSGEARERNHKKDLYCPWCNETVTTTEIRSNDAYMNLSGDVL